MIDSTPNITGDTENQPLVESVRLIKDTKSHAGATGFDMHYGLVLAIATLVDVATFAGHFV